MSLMPDIKCSRCERTFSGVRSRCPYCGARRATKGKHSEESDNTRSKMIIGLLLVVILIAAVIILAVTSSDVKDEQKDDSTNKAEVTETEKKNNKKNNKNTDEADAENEEKSEKTPAAEVLPVEAEPEAEVPATTVPAETKPAETVPAVTEDETKIEDIHITFWGDVIEDVTINVGDELELECSVSPDDIDTSNLKFKWESSDKSVLDVSENGVITALGETDEPAVVSVTVGGKTASCLIRIG